MKTSETLGQMSREPLEFCGKGLFREFDGILEPLTYPGLLSLKYLRIQRDKVLRWLDGDDAPLHVEQAVECGGVVAGIEERAEPSLGFALHLVVLAGKLSGGLLEPVAVGLHCGRE
jgi:hypothetical protein